MLGTSMRLHHHQTPKPRRSHHGPSNLERFIESTTPSVPAYKGSGEEEPLQHGTYFALADLWEAFGEWSVYGAGVPLVLNDRDAVVQYYVPYLSGMQLYCEERRRPGSARRSPEESDIDRSLDSSSDSSSDCELGRGIKNLSLKKYTSFSDGFSSDDSEGGRDPGHLLFEFFEHDVPYCRIPFADKISNLASYFPQLKTLRSYELLPSSWMSVAWYPIYRIPTGPTLRDLDACFLTFHSLSTPHGGTGCIPSPTIAHCHGGDDIPNISLPVFGLASYKFKNSIWTPRGGCQRQLVSSLMQSADNWLRLLRVNHPDYQFFVSRGTFYR